MEAASYTSYTIFFLLDIGKYGKILKTVDSKLFTYYKGSVMMHLIIFLQYAIFSNYHCFMRIDSNILTLVLLRGVATTPKQFPPWCSK